MSRENTHAKCTKCGGLGYASWWEGNAHRSVACETCNGTGELPACKPTQPQRYDVEMRDGLPVCRREWPHGPNGWAESVRVGDACQGCYGVAFDGGDADLALCCAYVKDALAELKTLKEMVR